MKVIDNLSSVISNFLCEGHCSYRILIFFFVIFSMRRRKASKMRQLYSKIELSFQEQTNSQQTQFLWNCEEWCSDNFTYVKPHFHLSQMPWFEIFCMHGDNATIVTIGKRFYCKFLKCLFILQIKYSLEI